MIKCGGTINPAKYVYDAFGRRVRKTTAVGSVDFLYDLSGHEITEVSSTGTWNRGEIYAGARHVATYTGGTGGTTYFPQADSLGTERVRINVSGGIYETCTSLPFGDWLTCSNTDPSPMHFTGDERDTETSLDHTQFRQYTSQLGRWITPDPLGGSIANPQSLNRYAYVGNNPLALTDPLGLHEECRSGCKPPPPSPCISTCSSGGFSWYPDDNAFFAEMETGASGYDIFDAIAGAPGTYISYNTHGQMSFGFSIELYQTTQNFIDTVNSTWARSPDPTMRQSYLTGGGFQVVTHDLGVDQITHGFVPEMVALQDSFRDVEANSITSMSPPVRNLYESFLASGLTQVQALFSIVEFAGAYVAASTNVRTTDPLANLIGEPSMVTWSRQFLNQIVAVASPVVLNNPPVIGIR